MGLFLDQSKPSPADFPRNEREAIFCILIGAVACDGDSQNDEESSALTSTLLNSRTIGHDQTKDLVIAHHKRCLHLWRTGDHSSILQSCVARINTELREPVFMHLCGLVLADDDLAEIEMRFIEMAQQALGIGEDRARTLLDGMIVLKKL
ncbi:MAG: TerB family tellurite resistance protein [Flavobacteriales bacterium]|nr:TerB family tellurite resistance protein [Flavobacteriales bacterium]